MVLPHTPSNRVLYPLARPPKRPPSIECPSPAISYTCNVPTVSCLPFVKITDSQRKTREKILNKHDLLIKGKHDTQG